MLKNINFIDIFMQIIAPLIIFAFGFVIGTDYGMDIMLDTVLKDYTLSKK